MNNKEFIDFMDEIFENIKELNARKSAEYNADGDKFSNIDASARLQNKDASQVIGGYMAKQIISLYDMIERGENQIDEVLLKEKCTDIIIYLVMLMAWNNC